MPGYGRIKELGRLRSILDRREPQIVRVTGIRGGGKTRLIQRVMTDYDGLYHRCPPLPDAAQHARLWERLERARSGRGLSIVDVESRGDWGKLFASIANLASEESRPFVLTLDDAHRLGEARSRFVKPLVSALGRAASEGRTVHAVLVGPEAGVTGEAAFSPHETETVRLGPLPFRIAAQHLPGNRPEDRLRAYSVFGGIPRVLSSVDKTLTVGTNVRRLLLDPSGALAEAASIWLEQDLQTPARYFAIMSVLSRGEAGWAAVHEGVPDLTKSGQLAPYLNRLGELGLITTRRSLDAGPRSRSARYAIADPLLAFWFRFVLPYRYLDGGDSASEYYARAIRPAIDRHVEQVFPAVCRQHMSHDAIETVGAAVREGGSLWGADYEIPVAGTLTSGAAYYGACLWTAPSRGDAPLDQLERSVRETRYGFGRERRIRLVFTGRPAPRWVQRAVARRHDAELIDAEALGGD